MLNGGNGTGFDSGQTGQNQPQPNTPPIHPLISLGLIDPKQFDQPNPMDDQDFGDRQQQSQADVQEEDTEEEKTFDWESDDNPYKSKVRELEGRIDSAPAKAGQTYEQQALKIEQEANAVHAQLTQQFVTTGKVPQEFVNALVETGKKAALAQAQLEAERAVLMPAAKREVAERLAKKYSAGKVSVSSAEILNEPTLEAMESRAKTLAEARRDGSFQQRKAQKADKVEGGSSSRGGIDQQTLAQLSPDAIIKLGLTRGQ